MIWQVTSWRCKMECIEKWYTMTFQRENWRTGPPSHHNGSPLFSCVLAENLPEAGQAVVAMGPEVRGLAMQKWEVEVEVEGWGSSWVGSRGAFVSITGSTERDISEGGTGAGLWADLSMSEVSIHSGGLLVRHNIAEAWRYLHLTNGVVGNYPTTYHNYVVKQLAPF